MAMKVAYHLFNTGFMLKIKVGVKYGPDSGLVFREPATITPLWTFDSRIVYKARYRSQKRIKREFDNK